MKTGNAYKDGFLALAEEYRRLLSGEGEVFIERIAREASVREVLVTVYNILKASGELVPLEALDGEEKAELWAEALKHLPSADKETRIQACKAFHALGTWCEIQNNGQPTGLERPPTRQQMGESWMYCTDCNAKLYSFDGSEDRGRRCPHPQKCREE